MVKTLRDTISKTLQVEYELPSKALEKLKDFESYFTDKIVRDLNPQSFNFTLSMPLRYVTQESKIIDGVPQSEFLGPNIDEGKYLYLEQWISISTTRFKEVFARDLMFGSFDVGENVLSFLTHVKRTVDKLNSPKFEPLYGFAIRSIFSKISENTYIQYYSTYTVLDLYVKIANRHIDKSNLSIQDEQLNDSFVKCIETYIDTVYYHAVKYQSSKTATTLKNFSGFLDILSKCCDNLESDGDLDTLEQLRLNVKEVLSDKIDMINEINEEYLDMKGKVPGSRVIANGTTSEDELNLISGPLNNLIQKVGFKVD